MVTTAATSIISLRNAVSGIPQGAPGVASDSALSGAYGEVGTEPSPEEDCYIPSAQRLAEDRLRNCVAAEQAPKNQEKKSLGEELLKTFIDFFKAPANIFMQKKATDNAVEGDMDRMQRIEDVKADYNKRYPVPSEKKHAGK
jgi:hypothetical protein